MTHVFSIWVRKKVMNQFNHTIGDYHPISLTKTSMDCICIRLAYIAAGNIWRNIAKRGTITAEEIFIQDTMTRIAVAMVA
jgi:hypothetical protein